MSYNDNGEQFINAFSGAILGALAVLLLVGLLTGCSNAVVPHEVKSPVYKTPPPLPVEEAPESFLCPLDDDDPWQVWLEALALDNAALRESLAVCQGTLDGYNSTRDKFAIRPPD